jgi:hypothetical protein
VYLNPKDIPPDDLDDEILARMIKEAGVFYELALKRKRWRVFIFCLPYAFAGTGFRRCFGSPGKSLPDLPGLD